jgi:Domain of unknown function (DUF4440)
MSTADDALRALNEDLVAQESAGNRDYFAQLLADEFAMRRADLTTFVDRETFIAGVAESPARINEDFDIVLRTSTLAVVRCTVATTKDGLPGRFNNVRLFVRPDEEDTWRLLAWVNETA